jgi:hypothetical protein
VLFRFTEELTVKRQVGVQNPLGVPGILVLSDPNPHRFTFDLCRKATQFGDVGFDQWWMAPATVYPQRKRSAGNFLPIVDYYWQLCLHHGSAIDDEVQNTFILANLLPLVRSNGGRRVFADSRPNRKQSGTGVRTIAAELDMLLQAGRQKEMNEVEFQKQTAEALGPPDYGPEVCESYQEFAESLLEPARAALLRDGEAGLQVAVDRWTRWNQSIGRRRGNKLEKQTLDVLSYECRAALHTCYSAVWYELILHLSTKREMSDASVVFHRLWHLDQREGIETASLPNSRLFHGHIFALHPACANFVLTRTGCELIGECLTDPSSKPAFHRLLNGLCIAMYDYARRNNVFALLRKKQPEDMEEHHLISLEEVRAERRAGRRYTKPRPSDAR